LGDEGLAGGGGGVSGYAADFVGRVLEEGFGY
jgi:hypothetical protein